MSAAWLQTYSGRAFDLIEPRADDVCLDDLARSLSRQARFLGHTLPHEPYSVAQHSVLVSREVERHGAAPVLVLVALLHDAAEAYTGDITAPMKLALRVSGGGRALADLEGRVDRAIAEWAGFDAALFSRVEVRRADLVLLATEARDLMAPAPKPWVELPPPAEGAIDVWDADVAEATFRARFLELRTA